MKAWHRLGSGLRFLFRRPSVERQMDEELRSFIAHRADALEQKGLPREEAERRARLECGSVENVKEEIRDGIPGGRLLDSGAKDLGHAFRLMRRSPGFTAAVVLTLALGIGGTSAMFTVVKGVLLDPLPYADPSRLVIVWSQLGAQDLTRAPASGFALQEIRSRARSLESLGGIWATNATFLGEGAGGGPPEQVKVGRVTGNFFDVLGAKPLIGRAIVAEDEGEGRPPVVLLSYGLWNRRFDANRDIVGRAVRMDGGNAVVIGVMPPGFRMAFPPDAQVAPDLQAWLPFEFNLAEGPRNLYFLRLAGRLRPGITPDQANGELATIAGELRGEFSEFATDRLGLSVEPMHRDAVREVRPALLALFAGIGLVLLIACANVANLMLGRSSVRGKEMALRAALGAGRGRLFGQALLESLALAVAGGALGVGVAWLALRQMAGLAPPGLLPADAATLDPGILAFTMVVTLGAGVLFGFAPALDASRVSLLETLRETGRGAAPRRRWRAGLIIAEVALGFVLLVGAGLMVRTFVEVLRVDPGFRPDELLTFEMDLPGSRYPYDAARVTLVRRVEDALRAMPGVEAAGGVSHLPLDDYANWYSGYAPEGADGQEAASLMADHRSVTPEYFDAIGADLVSGRWFDVLDEEAGRRVVVVDEIVAREAWPGEDPIGRKIEFEHIAELEFKPGTAEVVGVIRHIQHHALTRQVRGQIYIPFSQSPRWHISYVVRTSGNPASLVPAVRAAIAEIDPDLAVSKLRPMTFYLDRAAAASRFTMVLAACFSALALLLTVIGIYGVVAHSVSRRVREFGIRLAIGARPGQIGARVIREGMALALAGLIPGALVAWALSRMLRALLFGVSPTDPAVWLVAAILVPGVALLACWLPARRAMRSDPGAALRLE